MTNEEYNQKMAQLRELSNTPEMAQLVQELQTDYTKINADLTTAQEGQQKAEEKADKYAKLNNDLFLQCSAQNKIITTSSGVNGQEPERGQEPPKKRTYEDLEKEF